MSTKKPRILVTARLTEKWLDRLRKLGKTDLAGEATGQSPLSATDIETRTPSYDILVVETDPVTGVAIRANPDLLAIACCRGNPVNIDTQTAQSLGIPVLYTPGRNAHSVAEFTIGLIISQLRHISSSHHFLQMGGGLDMPTSSDDLGSGVAKENTWHTRDGVPLYRHFSGPEISTLTLGLVGYGDVGRQVATRAVALGMTVIATDPNQSSDQKTVTMVSLEELLTTSDILSLHCAVTPATQGMIGAREFAMLKPGAILVNTARAVVVDEKALLEALRNGQLGGAALDVFHQEPLLLDNPLFSFPNVTMTPHLAGSSTSVANHHSAMVVEDLEQLLSCRLPSHRFLAKPESEHEEV